MIRLNEQNRFILGEKFTKPSTEKNSTDFGTSIFFKPDELFKEGMTKDSFIDEYKSLMAGSIFGLKRNSESDSYDFSSISKNDMDEIEEIAEKYFNAVDKDKNGTLSEEEVTGLSERDGDNSSLSNEDIADLTDELFINPFTEESEKPTKENPTPPDDGSSTPHVTGGSTPSVSSAGNNTPSANTNSTPKTPALETAAVSDTSNEIKNKESRIKEIDTELTSLSSQKQVEKANDETYVSLVKQSQEYNTQISASEAKIDDYKGQLGTVEADLAAATAELNNTKDAELFKDYQAEINARRAQLQQQINSLTNKQNSLNEQIRKEEDNKKSLEDKKDSTDKEIAKLEAENPNEKINEINTKINQLTQEKDKLKQEVNNLKEKERKQAKDDAEVYGKAQAYRNSELTAKLLDPLLTPETKAKYDAYYKRTNGYSYCDQFIRNGTNDFYNSVLKALGVSDSELNKYTNTEKGILQSAGLNKSNVAGNEYIRECQETKTWGEDYQKILDASGIDMTASVDIASMSDAERKQAVRDGKIRPGMTFLTIKNGQCHVGFIESINKDLTWNTIEGNTYMKYSDGTSQAGTVGSHKTDATNQYLQGTSDVMAKVFYWMKMKGYSDAEIKKYLYNL